MLGNERLAAFGRRTGREAAATLAAAWRLAGVGVAAGHRAGRRLLARHLDAGYCPRAAQAAGGVPRAAIALDGLSARYGGPPLLRQVSGRFPAGPLTALRR